jgi:hypothetical protein
MNKSYERNLKLNIKLNGKITNHTSNNPMCGHFKKGKDKPLLFV